VIWSVTICGQRSGRAPRPYITGRRVFRQQKNDLADRRHSGFMFKVAFVTCTGARADITLIQIASADARMRISKVAVLVGSWPVPIPLVGG
jgi:hypothetical protein